MHSPSTFMSDIILLICLYLCKFNKLNWDLSILELGQNTVNILKKVTAKLFGCLLLFKDVAIYFNKW